MSARDPEMLATDQQVDALLERARAANDSDVHDRDTEPELYVYGSDPRSLRVRIADWLETIGVAIAVCYWGVVRWVRGVA